MANKKVEIGQPLELHDAMREIQHQNCIDALVKRVPVTWCKKNVSCAQCWEQYIRLYGLTDNGKAVMKGES